MHASIDNFRHPGAPSKLRKQAIASIGPVQPATVSEWLHCVTLKRFDEILGARVGKAIILMVARTGAPSKLRKQTITHTYVAKRSIELLYSRTAEIVFRGNLLFLKNSAGTDVFSPVQNFYAHRAHLYYYELVCEQ
jgi:ABC-type uncharacterized transport system permease subunit